MNDKEILFELAVLDGLQILENYPGQLKNEGIGIPDYLNSYDVIIPVINKIMGLNTDTRKKFIVSLNCELFPMGGNYMDLDLNECIWIIIHATPRQLCIALLKALGKWKD